MITMNFPKPANWQDFQTFIKDLMNEKYEGGFDVFGRNGQAQNGIDILGQDNGQVIGVQCKRFDSTKLTFKIVENEVNKADNNNPPLQKFIFVTTTPRDKNIQNEIVKLNINRQKNSLFKIEIWFWETIEDEVNNNLSIWNKYYDGILSKIEKSREKDQYILGTIRKAFSRPAFSTPFMYENSSNDFIQAIKDIQEFLNTGKLKNREGEYIAGSCSYRQLSSSKDVKDIDDVVELLQEIRDYTTNEIKSGKIKVCEGRTCFCITNYRTERRLDELRRTLLELLNSILKRNKIQPINIRY